jgi:hypothetical protein
MRHQRPQTPPRHGPPWAADPGEEIDRVQALTDLHVSPEVDRLMEEFSKTLRKIHEMERLLRMNEEAAQERSAQLKPTDFGWPDWVEPHMFVTHQGIVG